jgi:hypothetical protein
VPADRKRKKSAADVQKELRDLSKPDPSRPVQSPFDLKRIALRFGGGAVVVWILAAGIASWTKSRIPLLVTAVVTVAAVGLAVWAWRFAKKSQALNKLLQSADTAEGRKEALKRLDSDFKKNDTQALLARAQLELQEDPRKALSTLETIPIERQLAPVADQVRSMRAMIHLMLGETGPARSLVDAMEVGKQQEPKTRAMFAAVAGEAWGRTGQAKKAMDLLELFNPDDPEYAEIKMQMWRARAFAYAGQSDMKGASRALRKLADMNPHLLSAFVQGKRIHPLLQQEAKQILSQRGLIPRKIMRSRP